MKCEYSFNNNNASRFYLVLLCKLSCFLVEALIIRFLILFQR